MGFYKEPSTWRPFDLRVVTYNCIFFLIFSIKFINYYYKIIQWRQLGDIYKTKYVGLKQRFSSFKAWGGCLIVFFRNYTHGRI